MEENDAKKDERGFVVIDRRGRDDSDQPPQAAPEPEETAAGPPPEKPPAEERPLPKIDFSTFILSLSTSALYHLGLVEDPETRKPGPVNKDLARQTIDTLELLQEKTRGNLDPQEANLLENLLFELRMRFVESA